MEQREPARRLPVHPLLVAVIPVAALYLNNQDQVPLGDVALPVLLALAVAGIVYLVCWLAIKPASKAAVLASFLVFSFFTYGHARIALKTAWPRQSNLSGMALLVAVLAVMVLAWFAIRRSRRSFSVASSVLDVIALVTTLTLVVPIALTEIRAARLAGGLSLANPEQPEVTELAEYDGQLPDIYYIVCDRYPSAATARDIYGFDNSPFLDHLRARGFFVAESSRCNYARTDMSLATTMNMEYVGPAYDSQPPRLRRRFLYERIQDAAVWRRLRQAGYRTYHLGTWWRPTRSNRSADVNINYGILSEFLMEFYKTTLVYPVGAILDLDSHREQWIREQAKFAFLDTIRFDGAPVFVFAHFLLPHEPYVFAPDGEFQGRLRQMKVGVEQGFTGQLEYVNSRLKAWIDRVMADTSRESIIVLQSDEGPHPPENFSAKGFSLTVLSRLDILTAYYFPDADYSMLYRGISPVNTFRVLLAKFSGDIPSLQSDISHCQFDGEWSRIDAETR